MSTTLRLVQILPPEPFITFLCQRNEGTGGSVSKIFNDPPEDQDSASLDSRKKDLFVGIFPLPSNHKIVYVLEPCTTTTDLTDTDNRVY